MQRSAWLTSIGLHGFLVLCISYSFLFSVEEKESYKMTMAVVEKKPINEQKPEIKKIVKDQPPIRTQKKSPPKKQKPVKKIFGISKKTLKSNKESSSTVQLKDGNTVVKKQDEIRDKPEELLPEPVEEYLVTQMPKIKDEVRIKYPESARRRGAEGQVVFELLIDETGKVRDAKLIKGPDKDLNEAAQKAIFRFVFEPAKVGENAVAILIRYAYTFVLEN